jgi:hypothetical protein
MAVNSVGDDRLAKKKGGGSALIKNFFLVRQRSAVFLNLQEFTRSASTYSRKRKEGEEQEKEKRRWRYALAVDHREMEKLQRS